MPPRTRVLPHPVRVLPQIRTGTARSPLPQAVLRRVERVVVDTCAHLPDMFEITLAGWDGDAPFTIGTEVAISSAGTDDERGVEVITGEVTAVEGEFTEVDRTVVRGYTKDHRFQRAHRSRTFLNSTDADIARRVAADHGIPVGAVDPTRTAHDHVGQVNQTDWEFLAWRAAALGFDFGVRGGEFFFTRAVDAGRGRAAVELTLRDNLVEFRPRVTAGNLTGKAEVRVWDPAAGKVVGQVKPTTIASTDLSAADPATLAGLFAPKGPPPPAAASKLGPAPSAHGHVDALAPLAVGQAVDIAATEAATGFAEHHGSTAAEAVGTALGDPALVAGVVAEVVGAGATFSGKWAITRAVHSWDVTGYLTRFEVSGRHRRTLLGLAGGAGAAGSAPRVEGVQSGVVTDIGDPQGLHRVRVALPWLSPSYESDWAPVAQLGGTASGGTALHPEVGDAVLVAFEFGDPRRPYVLAGLPTGSPGKGLGGDPVLKSGANAAIAWRGIVTPTGNRLAFHDEVGPGGGAPKASDLLLGTAGGELALVLDQTAGTVALRCKPVPPGSKSAKGQLVIEVGDGGSVEVRAGAGGQVTVDGGERLTLTARAGVKIDSAGPVEIKGNPIKLN
ncbi:VgrG-related protein [Actinokineospora bangkokensis]|uniref:Gp5/Type VI secretion system Vgr protein OB-fold domain-containing protein n=1 Tax=Actinokineospora bangkokensis TaxID=1193682 RepID=A0A1Q9LLH1_9PSEU|nr:VgrG-related protein [Actinokineospora bangkokensis]OLR92865.1 hypothetical protein BJP25_19260 [Actinokineospora bangkokensis]